MMNTNRWLLLGLAVLVLVVIVGGRLLWNDESAVGAAGPVTQGEGPAPYGGSQLPVLTTAGTVASTPPGTDPPLPPMPVSTVDAAESMSRANEHGDPSAPPIVRDAPREAPTAAELADPSAYQRYEARQTQRLYSEYVKAADNEIPRLQADIARARAAGLPPEQIAEGEEKLRRIQAMRDQLKAEKGATPAAPAEPAAP